MKPKAFVLEPPRFDISWLYTNYEVHFVFPDASNNSQFRAKPELLYELVHNWASTEFVPTEDYFVLTGNLVLMVMAVLAIQEAHTGESIRMLRYDDQKQQYHPIIGARLIGQS